jgi:mRNA interferase MazF
MGVPAVGDVVLVPFPFSDLSSAKVRPAVALADVGRGDWVLCQITTNPYGDPHALALDVPDFASGGLLAASYARPGKLFTASTSLIHRTVGTLNHVAFNRTLDSVLRLLRPAAKP